MKRINITKGTIIRTILLVLALINQVLAVFGKSPIPIDDDTLTNLISTAWTVIASLIAWWKNNSFTDKAIKADEVLKNELIE